MLGSGGVGLGFRSELAADLLRSPRSVDFVEVVAESCFVQPATHREACALTELWPVVPHGVKLSLGSAEGIEPERARALGALARELRAPVISEHVAFVRGGGREIGHLTALPYTRTAVDVVVRNVARARRFLPDVPLCLENVAWSFQWPESEMSEGDFYSEIARRTGCPLLFDVGNAYANALNAGEDPWLAAQRFPLDRVGMIHLAGGIAEHGFYFDDHAHAVPEPVFELLYRVLGQVGQVPILIERDALFPEWSELEREVSRCRDAQRGLPRVRPESREPKRASFREADESARAGLASAEASMARLLTEVDAPPAEAEACFGAEALARSRAILKRKRVDEALPILSWLSRRKPELDELARSVVESTPRLPRLCAIADAWQIAERALAVPALADDARRDCLIFRSRFTKSDGAVEPRSAPFVGRETLGDGSRIWALKGPGSRSRVRTIERNRAQP